MEFADKVKYVRKQLNLSQEKLASLLGGIFCYGQSMGNRALNAHLQDTAKFQCSL